MFLSWFQFSFFFFFFSSLLRFYCSLLKIGAPGSRRPSVRAIRQPDNLNFTSLKKKTGLGRSSEKPTTRQRHQQTFVLLLGQGASEHLPCRRLYVSILSSTGHGTARPKEREAASILRRVRPCAKYRNENGILHRLHYIIYVCISAKKKKKKKRKKC